MCFLFHSQIQLKPEPVIKITIFATQHTGQSYKKQAPSPDFVDHHFYLCAAYIQLDTIYSQHRFCYLLSYSASRNIYDY